MRHWFRPHLRALAAVVLVSLSTLATWSFSVHELDCHDQETLVVVHDASAHAFRAAVPPEDTHPIHCVLCHWARSFGPSVQSVTLAPSIARLHVQAVTFAVRVALLYPAAQPPLRAPPVPLFLTPFA